MERSSSSLRHSLWESSPPFLWFDFTVRKRNRMSELFAPAIPDFLHQVIIVISTFLLCARKWFAIDRRSELTSPAPCHRLKHVLFCGGKGMLQFSSTAKASHPNEMYSGFLRPDLSV